MGASRRGPTQRAAKRSALGGADGADPGPGGVADEDEVGRDEEATPEGPGGAPAGGGQPFYFLGAGFFLSSAFGWGPGSGSLRVIAATAGSMSFTTAGLFARSVERLASVALSS